MNDNLEPSKTPLHSNLWVGRPPSNRELTDEFNNTYKLLRQILEELKHVKEFVGMPED